MTQNKELSLRDKLQRSIRDSKVKNANAVRKELSFVRKQLINKIELGHAKPSFASNSPTLLALLDFQRKHIADIFTYLFVEEAEFWNNQGLKLSVEVKSASEYTRAFIVFNVGLQ